MNPAPPTPSDRLLKTFWIAAAGTLLISVVAVAGSAALLVLDRVLRDGPFLLLWCVAAAGYGYWPTRSLAAGAGRPLRAVTSVGVGIGVISLLTLGLGTIGWLIAWTAYGLLGLGVTLLPWRTLYKLCGTYLSLPVTRETTGERADFVQRTSQHSQSCESTPSLRVQAEGGVGPRRTVVSPLIFAWLPIIALGGIMLVADCVPPGLLWTDEPHGYDVVEYHLQVPREWYEAGRITPLDHNVFSYLPMNVEMHYLLAMHLRGGPWAGMYLAQLMNGVFVVVTLLTLLLSLGSPAALLVAAVPWLPMLGSICYVEAGQLMWATLATVWLLGGGTRRTAILAGVCGGFASGAKLTSVPMLVLALPAALVLARCLIGANTFSVSLYPGSGRRRGLLINRPTSGVEHVDLASASTTALTPSASYVSEKVEVRGRAERLAKGADGQEPLTPTFSPSYEGEGVRNAHTSIRYTLVGCLSFAFVALLVFSPWLIRTCLHTGNPIFPEAMHLFGRGPFTAVQQQRWEQSLQPAASFHSLIGRLAAAWQQILGDWRWGFAILPIAVAACVARWRISQVIVITLAMQMLFWMSFTHLQGRFALLMLPILALGLGQLDSLLWRRVVVGIGIIMCIADAAPLLQRLSPVVPVIGVENFKDLLPPIAADAIDAGQPIALIGDAKAFWYQTPMSKLHYRTVFDVQATPDQAAADHWLDPGDTSEAVRIVDESELQRFHRTYFGLPKAP